MEAPEKIYIIPHTLTDGFCRRWFEEPFKRECIEYIRKDAFIEKAEKVLETFLDEHFVYDMDEHQIYEDMVIEYFSHHIKKIL